MTRRGACAALLCGLAELRAQTSQTQTTPPKNASPRTQFFHGHITKFDSEHVTVSRKLVGRPRETRTFLIRAETKLNRVLRLRSNVTVRFQHWPEGDIALDIQVHLAPTA